METDLEPPIICFCTIRKALKLAAGIETIFMVIFLALGGYSAWATDFFDCSVVLVIAVLNGCYCAVIVQKWIADRPNYLLSFIIWRSFILIVQGVKLGYDFAAIGRGQYPIAFMLAWNGPPELAFVGFALMVAYFLVGVCTIYISGKAHRFYMRVIDQEQVEFSKLCRNRYTRLADESQSDMISDQATSVVVSTVIQCESI